MIETKRRARPRRGARFCLDNFASRLACDRNIRCRDREKAVYDRFIEGRGEFNGGSRLRRYGPRDVPGRSLATSDWGKSPTDQFALFVRGWKLSPAGIVGGPSLVLQLEWRRACRHRRLCLRRCRDQSLLSSLAEPPQL